MSAWPNGRSRHGGIDEVPLPGTKGRLWLCGKHFIAPDPSGALASIGASTVVCFCEEAELSERYPAYVEWLRTSLPERALWYPIADLHAPDIEEAVTLVAVLRDRLDRGGTLLLHCGAGIGRAGTVAAAVLMSLGHSRADAIAIVASSRPTAGPEAGAQAALLEALERELPYARSVPSGADRPDVELEPTFTLLDDGPWQRVRAQRHPDGSERSVRDRWFVIGRDPQYMSLLSRWDPGVVVHRHGHWGHQVIYVTRGEVTIGERLCGPGTHIDLPLGASIGPMIAGPEGVDMLEVTWGDPRSWSADPDEFARVLAERGIEPLPNPPIDLPEWLEDRRM